MKNQVLSLSLAGVLLLANAADALANGIETTHKKEAAATYNTGGVLLRPYTSTTTNSVLLKNLNLAVEGTDWDPTTEEERNAKHRKYGEFYFGWNNWRNGDGKAMLDANNPQTTELDFWNSMTWGFGFGTRTRIGEGKLGIRYGLQFNWHFYRLKGNTVVMKTANPEGIAFVQDQTQNYKKSTYRNTFLDLPILLDVDLRQNAHKGLGLAFGGYAGIRLGTSTKLKFNDTFGDDVKLINHDPNFGNIWRYGLMGQLGFGEFKLTGKWDLSTIFEQGNYTTPDYQAFSFTIGWVMP